MSKALEHGGDGMLPSPSTSQLPDTVEMILNFEKCAQTSLSSQSQPTSSLPSSLLRKPLFIPPPLPPSLTLRHYEGESSAEAWASLINLCFQELGVVWTKEMFEEKYASHISDGSFDCEGFFMAVESEDTEKEKSCAFHDTRDRGHEQPIPSSQIAGVSERDQDLPKVSAPSLVAVATCFAWKVGQIHRLHWLAVSPLYRRRGLARTMVFHVLQHLEAQGVREVRLVTEPYRLSAIQLYLGSGVCMCAYIYICV